MVDMQKWLRYYIRVAAEISGTFVPWKLNRLGFWSELNNVQKAQFFWELKLQFLHQNTEVSNEELVMIKLKSLILAQDESWRHA